METCTTLLINITSATIITPNVWMSDKGGILKSYSSSSTTINIIDSTISCGALAQNGNGFNLNTYDATIYIKNTTMNNWYWDNADSPYNWQGGMFNLEVTH